MQESDINLNDVVFDKSGKQIKKKCRSYEYKISSPYNIIFIFLSIK